MKQYLLWMRFEWLQMFFSIEMDDLILKNMGWSVAFKIRDC